MKLPASEAHLKQARRNQEFTHSPMGVARCGLMAKEVAIFPVRYALDESPTTKGSPQGPNPLPKGWSSPLPGLQTRSYTLRQLRDGWVYVWNSVDETLHEYQVDAEYFIRHKWTEAQINQDIRYNPGESNPYLLYPRNAQLRMAYSPVQWTWRMCERMRSSVTAQTQWMRMLDVPAFCKSGTVPHGAWLTELGNSVADILNYGKEAPSFTSTMLPTQPGENQNPFKPAFEEALVRGRVPQQDTALFIALDDPLAIVDDLSMNLSGRLMEYSRFEDQHQQKLESAMVVESLCGFDVDAFVPTFITDPLQRHAYCDDLYGLLAETDVVERGKDLVPEAYAGMVEAHANVSGAAIQAAFKAKWGSLPDFHEWRNAVDSWNDRRLWREDVHFDDVRSYLSQTLGELLRLQAHCQRSERDLLNWLDCFAPNADAVFHDICDARQASELMKTAHTLYTELGSGESGQQWLCGQAVQPNTLFGLALFNFNPELADLIKQVTHNFSTTGSLDGLGLEGDGSTSAMSPYSASDMTSLGSRVNEMQSVLDLEGILESKAFKAMSNTAQQATKTLVQIANDHAKEEWHGLSTLLLPAMKGETALFLAAPQAVISREISYFTRLVFHPSYQRDFQTWLREVTLVQKKITGTKSVLHRPGAPHDQHAARIALHGLEMQMKDLFLRRPNQITATTGGGSRLTTEWRTVNGWLDDLGQAEVLTQQKMAGTPEHANRVKAWMGQNLGTALPALLIGLNAWNVFSSANQARNDGRFTAAEWRTLAANAGYAGNAIAALWVGPAWNRAGKMTTELGRTSLKVAEAGYAAWLKAATSSSSTRAQATTAGEFAAFSKGLILRTVTWAALGTIAAMVEAWQISEDINDATSELEKTVLTWKRFIVGGMGAAATVQLLGAGLGYWFTFAWVMAAPVTILLALLGIAYLLITMVANRYKREGLRLWLYRCNWGLGAIPGWQGSQGHRSQMMGLLETLQRPSVVGKALFQMHERRPAEWHGFWLHIQIPRLLAGKELKLQPALVKKNHISSDQLLVMADSFYGQFLRGNWVAPEQLGALPRTGNNILGVDFIYSDQDQHFVWQAWIENSTPSPILELEIKYPESVLQRDDGRGYLFRVALGSSTNEADRINTAFSGELTEEDDIVLRTENTRLLTLTVPNVTPGARNVQLD